MCPVMQQATYPASSGGNESEGGMITTIDKAVQDFIVSALAIGAYFGYDFSSWQTILVTLGGAFTKALVTWLVPNKPA